ncbi:Golgi transport complex subunit 6 [Ascosphaera pollenicola]|nr:Golgi transport complex subunit 6 [Ascosphaera pollenicola]
MDAPIESLISPSRARQAALQAKDWALVTNWLAEMFAPDPVPAFERNEDTLRVLLDLAAANAVADDQAKLVQQAERDTLCRLKAQGQCFEEDPRSELLEFIEAALGSESSRLIDDIDQSSVALGTLTTDVSDVGSAIIDLTREAHQAQHQLRKTSALVSQLEKELAGVRQQLDALRSKEIFLLSPELPMETSDQIRDTKRLNKQIDEYASQLASLVSREQDATLQTPRLEDVIDDERRIMDLKKQMQELQVEHR